MWLDLPRRRQAEGCRRHLDRRGGRRAGPEIPCLLGHRQRRALLRRAGEHRQPDHGPVALYAMHVSTQPADRRHQFGHHKAEYFSAVLEGVLIVLAALLIFREAYDALLMPRPFNEPAQRVLINGARHGHQCGLVVFPAHLGPPPALARAGRRRLAPNDGRGNLLRRPRRTVCWRCRRAGRCSTRRWRPLVAANILWAGWRLVREFGERPDGRGRDGRGRPPHPRGDLQQCRRRDRGPRRQDAHGGPRDLHRVPPGRPGHA